MTENSNTSDARIQVVPIGIEFFDQSDLPSSIILLQLLLASDRVLRILKLFVINEHADFVFLGEALHQFQFMLRDAADEVVGYADLQRAANAAREYEDLEAAWLHLKALEYQVARS
jgi:hypothetical protein